MKKNNLTALILAATLYLGLSNGHLAIFHGSDPNPLQILPYDASLFSETDTAALCEGIPFSTAAEMNRLLEDYTS